jgi:hypothetical protein
LRPRSLASDVHRRYVLRPRSLASDVHRRYVLRPRSNSEVTLKFGGRAHVLRPRSNLEVTLKFGGRAHVLRPRISFESVVTLCGLPMARVFFRYLLPTERLQAVGEPSGDASSSD